MEITTPTGIMTGLIMLRPTVSEHLREAEDHVHRQQ